MRVFKALILSAFVAVALICAAATGYACEYDIKIVVADGNGNEIDELSEASEINISVTADGIGEAISTTLYAAFYDENGALAGVQSKSRKLFKLSGTQSFSFEAENILYGKDGNLKVFLWNDLKPMTGVYTHKRPEVKITGLYQPYQTLTVKSNEDIVSCKWYRSAMKNGNYTQIVTDADENYEASPEDGNRWIKAEVKLADGRIFDVKEAKYIESAYANSKIGLITSDSSTQFSSAAANAPDEYIFEAEGIEFVLLDVTESDCAKYLITTKNTLGDRVYYKNTDEDSYPISCFNNLAAYLNNEYKAKYIPENIQKHIYNDYNWQYEAGYWGYGTDGYFKCGIAVPSVNEILKYCGRMGLSNDMCSWWTRSGHGEDRDTGGVVIVMPGESGLIGTTSSDRAIHSKHFIRPIFYADKDFFSGVELSYLGEEVRKIFLENTSLENFLIQNGGKYTAEQLDSLFFGECDRIDFTLAREKYSPAAELTAMLDVAAGTYEIVGEYDGNEFFRSSQYFDSAFYGEKEYCITLPYGIWDLTFSVYKDGKIISKKIFREATVTNDFSAGACRAFNLRGYCYPVADYAMLRKSGANIVRPNNLYWRDIEKEKGIYTWDKFDAVMAELNSADCTVMLTLAYGNTLYDNSSEKTVGDYDTIEGFVSFAKAVAERYPEIKYYEIWNEANASSFWKPFPSSKDYAALVQITERALKNVNPDITVVSGAFADANQNFAGKAFEENIYDYSDAVSSHPYVYYYGEGSDGRLKNNIVGINKFSLKYGGWKQNFITEIGFPTNIGSVTEEHSRQAAEIVKQFVIADASDIDGTIVYDFSDYGADDANAEHRFGVLNENSTPKKAYIAGQSFIKNTENAVYAGKTELSEEVTGYVYYGEGGCVAVVWSTGNDAEVELNSEAVIYDMYGNCRGKGSSVSVSCEPLYLTGLSDEWAIKAAHNTVKEKINDYLEQTALTQYKYLFEKSLIAAADGDTSDNSELLSEKFKEHLDISNEIFELYQDGSIDITTLSTLLATVEASGRYWGILYAISGPELTELNSGRISGIKEKISYKETGESIGSTLPVSRAIIKQADNYADKMKILESTGKKDSFSTGIMSMWDIMTGYLCDVAERLYAIENPEINNILIKVPIKAAVLKYNERSSLDVSVYNYDARAIDGAVLRVVDSFGNIAGEAEVSVPAGDSVRISVDVLIPDGGADTSMAEIMLIKDGQIIKSEKAVVMDQMKAFTTYKGSENAFLVDTDAANMFTVDNQEFILLDVSDDESAKYFCICKDIYGPSIKAFHLGNVQYFNAEDEKSIAYWLNNEFCSSYLPEAVKRHIDFDHYYLTERGSASGASPFDFQARCGVALLSMTELEMYKDRLGMVDGNFPETYTWKQLLRSSEQRPDWNWRSMMISVNRIDDIYQIGTEAYFANYREAVRPVFWLDGSFFDEENVTDIGENVKAIIK